MLQWLLLGDQRTNRATFSWYYFEIPTVKLTFTSSDLHQTCFKSRGWTAVGLCWCVVWWKAEHCDNAGGQYLTKLCICSKDSFTLLPWCIMKYYPLPWLHIYVLTAPGVTTRVFKVRLRSFVRGAYQSCLLGPKNIFCCHHGSLSASERRNKTFLCTSHNLRTSGG